MGVSRKHGASNTSRGLPQVSERGVAAETGLRAAVVGRMEQLLTCASSAWTGGKQRLTAMRLHEPSCAAKDSRWEPRWSETTCGSEKRRQKVFVPLVYRPGDLGEIDCFEVLVDVAGKLARGGASVSCCGRCSPAGTSPGSSRGRIRSAFSKDMSGPSPTWAGCPTGCCTTICALRCGESAGQPARAEPAVRGARQSLPLRVVLRAAGDRTRQGRVESRGRAVRLSELVPIPAGPDLDTISRALMDRLDARAATTCDRDGRTVLESDSVEEQAAMLPADGFRSAAVRLGDGVPQVARADRGSLVLGALPVGGAGGDGLRG